MTLRAVLLSFLLSLAGAASGAGPSLPQILSSQAAAQGEKSIEIVPDPSQLSADWWLFFNVDAGELPARGRQVRELLERRYAASGEGGKLSRPQEVARVLASLDAYIAARRLPPPEPTPLPDVSEIYTPGEALELVSGLRNARVDLEFDLNELAAQQAATESARTEVDRALAAYLQLDGGPTARLDPGLSLMTDRIALASSELQLRQRRAAVEIRRSQVDALEEVERRAESRLRGDPGEIAQLQQRLPAIAIELETARRRLVAEKRRMLQSTADTLEQQVAARLARQRVVRADIQIEALQLEQARTELQIVFNQLLLEPAPPVASARAALERAREAIDRARESITVWVTASERERLADAGSGAGAPAVALLEINQARLRLAQESIGTVRGLRDSITRIEFLSRWTGEGIREGEGPIARTLGRVSAVGGELGHWLGSITERSIFRLGETPVTLKGLLKVLVIVLVAWLLSWLFRRALSQLGQRFPKESQSLLFVIGRLAHYLIILIGVMAGLSSIGLSFANFALVVGALALGVGFGLQSIVNNFLSGLILFFEQTVKVGDFVELDNGEQGEVRAINVRGTIVNTNDNIDVVVPNSQFTERKVINWTLLDPFRRIHVPFRVAYESDEDRVVAAGLDAASRLSTTLTGVLGREPSVWLVNYGENGLDFELIVWLMPDAVKRPQAVFAAYHWEIRKALRRHGIEVPVPQREIRFRGPLPGSDTATALPGALPR